jgi:hypothetical protein
VPDPAEPDAPTAQVGQVVDRRRGPDHEVDEAVVGAGQGGHRDGGVEDAGATHRVGGGVGEGHPETAAAVRDQLDVGHGRIGRAGGDAQRVEPLAEHLGEGGAVEVEDAARVARRHRERAAPDVVPRPTAAPGQPGTRGAGGQQQGPSREEHHDRSIARRSGTSSLCKAHRDREAL